MVKAKHKELLSLGMTFLHQFNEEHPEKEYMDVRESLEMLGKQAKVTLGNQAEAVKYGTACSLKLTEVSGQEEIDANLLLLSIGLVGLLMEDDFFKGSRAMTVKRLYWGIYNKIESYHQFTDQFRNSNKLIAKLEDKYNE